MSYTTYIHLFSWGLLFSLALSACQSENNSAGESSADETSRRASADSALFYIGVDSITEEALSIRTQITALDSQVQHPRSLALLQLLKASAQEQIAEHQGFPLKSKYLRWEAERIDSSTLQPKYIQKVKGLCGDTALYLDLFIRPSLLPRWMSLHYDWDASIHQKTGAQVMERFSHYLVHPEDMDKSDNRKVFWIDSNSIQLLQNQADTSQDLPRLMDKSEVRNPMLKAQVEKQLKQKGKNPSRAELYQALEGLQAGQLHPKVVQWKKEYWIVQMLEIEKTRKKIKIIRLPKRDYFDWEAEQIKTIPLRVRKDTVWKAAIQHYPVINNLFFRLER